MSKKSPQPKVKTEFSDNLTGHLLKALDADSEFSEAHFQLALMYQKNGDQKGAETHLRKAIESDIKLAREIKKHGEKLLEKFQFQNAKILFMKAQTKKHHCAEAHFNFPISTKIKKKYPKRKHASKIVLN